jgi:hypothetical protein
MAMNGVAEVLAPLTEAGYHVDDQDADNRTPLHLAVIGNHADVVKTLVELCHADVNHRDLNNLLPFHYALSIDMDNVVENAERAISKAYILRYLAQRTDPEKVRGRKVKRILDQLKENPSAVIAFEVSLIKM